MMSANAFKIVLRFSSLYFDEPCPCQRKTQYTPDTQAPARGHTRHPSLSTWAHPIPKPQHAGTPDTQAPSQRANPTDKPTNLGNPPAGSPLHPSPSTRAHPCPNTPSIQLIPPFKHPTFLRPPQFSTVPPQYDVRDVSS